MKISKKTALVFTLVCLFLIGLAVPSYSWTRKNVQKIEKFYNSKLSPIIMIPGSSATENRFDGLVTKLNQDRQGTKHSLLKARSGMMGPLLIVGVLMPKTMNRLSSLVLKTTRMATAILKSKPRWLTKLLKPCKKNITSITLRDWPTPMEA